MLNSRFFVFVAAVASAAKFRDSTSDASPNAIELEHARPNALGLVWGDYLQVALRGITPRHELVHRGQPQPHGRRGSGRVTVVRKIATRLKRRFGLKLRHHRVVFRPVEVRVLVRHANASIGVLRSPV